MSRCTIRHTITQTIVLIFIFELTTCSEVQTGEVTCWPFHHHSLLFGSHRALSVICLATTAFAFWMLHSGTATVSGKHFIALTSLSQLRHSTNTLRSAAITGLLHKVDCARAQPCYQNCCRSLRSSEPGCIVLRSLPKDQAIRPLLAVQVRLGLQAAACYDICGAI